MRTIPHTLKSAELPAGVKFRIVKPLVLTEYGTFPKGWKPKWGGPVLESIGDMSSMLKEAA